MDEYRHKILIMFFMAISQIEKIENSFIIQIKHRSSTRGEENEEENEEEKRNVGFDHSKTSIQAQQGEKKMKKKREDMRFGLRIPLIYSINFIKITIFYCTNICPKGCKLASQVDRFCSLRSFFTLKIKNIEFSMIYYDIVT